MGWIKKLGEFAREVVVHVLAGALVSALALEELPRWVAAHQLPAVAWASGGVLFVIALLRVIPLWVRPTSWIGVVEVAVAAKPGEPYDKLRVRLRSSTAAPLATLSGYAIGLVALGANAPTSLYLSAETSDLSILGTNGNETTVLCRPMDTTAVADFKAVAQWAADGKAVRVVLTKSSKTIWTTEGLQVTP